MNDIALASNYYASCSCLVGLCSGSNAKCCYGSSIMTEAYFQIAFEIFYPMRVRRLQNQAIGTFAIGHLIARCAVMSIGIRSTTWRGCILHHCIASSVLFQLLLCNRVCNWWFVRVPHFLFFYLECRICRRVGELKATRDRRLGEVGGVPAFDYW